MAFSFVIRARTRLKILAVAPAGGPQPTPVKPRRGSGEARVPSPSFSGTGGAPRTMLFARQPTGSPTPGRGAPTLNNRRSAATEVRHNGGAPEAHQRLPDMPVETG